MHWSIGAYRPASIPRARLMRAHAVHIDRSLSSIFLHFSRLFSPTRNVRIFNENEMYEASEYVASSKRNSSVRSKRRHAVGFFTESGA